MARTIKATFSVIRNKVTATSVTVSIMSLSTCQRVVLSIFNGHHASSGRYHKLAIADNLDLSSTDYLEETTGAHTGIIYDIVNKRSIGDDHLELDLERIYAY